MSREILPDRRRSWNLKGKLRDGSGAEQTFYLGFGEYTDGRLGEIWVDAAKEGTFVRGVLSALARTISMTLQMGTPLTELVKLLNGISFPPDGIVVCDVGPTFKVSSIADWIAQEIEHWYINKPEPPQPQESEICPQPSPSAGTNNVEPSSSI